MIKEVIKIESKHADHHDALLILSITPTKPNRKYLRSAVRMGLLKSYPRGKQQFVYDREDLNVLAGKLDREEVVLNSSNYSMCFDFDYESQKQA